MHLKKQVPLHDRNVFFRIFLKHGLYSEAGALHEYVGLTTVMHEQESVACKLQSYSGGTTPALRDPRFEKTRG